MDVIDYGSSFLVCNWPYNAVRFWVESRTRVIDEASGDAEDYYQCAACKSEDTFAKRDLFQPDNYDFTPIFGPQWGVIFRRKAYLHDNYKSVQPVSQMWEGPRYDGIRRPRVAHLVSEPAAIADATHQYRPIVAQTELRDEQHGRRIIFEYPVKTMNINREHGWYQTDTGPIAFIDPGRTAKRAADAIELAYVAFNAPHFADFVVEQPTPLSPDGSGEPQMHHFSRRESFEAQNRLYALEI